jgi:hypothetical protein
MQKPINRALLFDIYNAYYNKKGIVCLIFDNLMEVNNFAWHNLSGVIETKQELKSYVEKKDGMTSGAYYQLLIPALDIKTINKDKFLDLISNNEWFDKNGDTLSVKDQNKIVMDLIKKKVSEQGTNTIKISEKDLGENRTKIALFARLDGLAKEGFIQKGDLIFFKEDNENGTSTTYYIGYGITKNQDFVINKRKGIIKNIEYSNDHLIYGDKKIPLGNFQARLCEFLFEKNRHGEQLEEEEAEEYIYGEGDDTTISQERIKGLVKAINSKVKEDFGITDKLFIYKNSKVYKNL